MSYAQQHLDEAARNPSPRSTQTPIERVVDVLAQVRRRRRAAVLPRRRRQRRQLLARGERLPQDRRHRGLRADRQRLRADRAHQRRGLGHASSSSGCRCSRLRPRRRGVRVLGRRRQPGEEHQPEPRAPRCSYAQDGRRHASSASSAATAATPRRSPTPASSSRPSTRTRSRRTPRRSRRSSGTCWCRIPRSRSTPTKWESAVDCHADAPCSSTATACSIARSCATASRTRPPRSPSSRSCPAWRDALARLQARRVSASSWSPISPTWRAARPRASRSRPSTSRLARSLPLDEFRVCYHDDADGCDCRKPQPGLLLRGRRASSASTSRRASWSATAGATSRPAGARAAGRCFIDYGYEERQPDDCRHPGRLAATRLQA